MSLFPAYSTEPQAECDVPPNPPLQDSTTQWLENESFPLNDAVLKHVQDSIPNPIAVSDDSSDNSGSATEDDVVDLETPPKKSKSENSAKTRTTVQRVLEFDGNEEYYIDKKPTPQYKTIKTLHKPACPRYLRKPYILGYGYWSHWTNKAKPMKRYCKASIKKSEETNTLALDENEYTLQLGQLNRKTMEAPAELQHWLDLIQLQQRNPYKWSRLLLAEKKLDLLQRAFVYHPRCELLYRQYIDTISDTYPSFEVSKMLDRMLAKDAYNYTLWTAQIMTTQGSMARCVVPDVLRIYERCMQKMHHKQKQTPDADTCDSDEIMLKLFNNCVLFLRQAGLNEQFFALVKLALELNVSTVQFEGFAPRESDQQTLIEYEELILQSGLPMNEIWLRIEKLRQGFNFLPCPVDMKCSDPQRIVFNEDVCHFIYPLKSRDNSFFLMLLILRLLKVPFVQSDGLAEKFSARVEHIGDSDAVEDVLAGFVRHTFALPLRSQNEFRVNLYELVKEMAVSPTYLNNAIGHEIYIRCMTQTLLDCSRAYAGIDERKRIVFALLWCRLEVVLLVMQKCSGKLTPDYVKEGRKRFKNFLKQGNNRHVINFYREFAVFEFEALQEGASIEPVQNIFDNVIAANSANETLSSDLCHAVVTYGEMLIGSGQSEAALQVFAAYVLSIGMQDKALIGTAKKLSAVKSIAEKLESVAAIERNVEIMILEQHFLPDYTVSLIKLHALMQYLVGKKMDAIAYLDKMLKIFLRTSDRHSFLREHIQELYITLLQLPSSTCFVSKGLISEKIFAALEEFPRNMFFLQQCVMIPSAAWYKIRMAMLRTNVTVQTIVFLIALARYRFINTNQASDFTSEVLVALSNKHSEQIVRNRILNTFNALTATTTAEGKKHHGALQRNALFWRFYLRCLSDQNTAFETSKKCLLTALDECPWSKALYLDGATYVPQELSHLQDLIIEKQLRIYALPEELEILRE